MNKKSLIETFRSRVGDEKEPFLWSAAEVDEYLNDAHNEAAERAMLLRDATTAEICERAVAPNVASYDLDGRIIEVVRAKLDLQLRPLKLTNTEAIDIDRPEWDSETADDEQECLVIDPSGSGWVGRLVPPPSIADVLRLQVIRLPLEELKVDKDEPEIRPDLHVRLLDWVCYRAYSKQDTETQDDDKAETYAAAFAANFGPKRDAKTNRTQHDMQFPVVRPMGL